MAKRYGSAFTLRLPIFGEAVVVSDPALIKDLFTTNTDLIARAGVLGEMFGPGSTFSLDGAEHRYAADDPDVSFDLAEVRLHRVGGSVSAGGKNRRDSYGTK